VDIIASSNRKAIIGLGATGLSCARFFQRRGIPFVMMDTRDEPAGAADFRQQFPDVPLYLGGVDQDVLLACDEIDIDIVCTCCREEDGAS